MTIIKVLGTGCATCKRLLADVSNIVAKNNWQVQVEYVTDITAILAYGVLDTPALMFDDVVLMTGHPGAAKVEQVLKARIEMIAAKEIFPTEAFSKMQQGALFVDVREKSELDAEAYDVPDLLHIPLGELEHRFAEIPRDRDVVLVCRGGGRSLHALHFLIGQGYVNAINMKQGILGWMHAGFPVHKNNKLTKNMGFINLDQL